MYMRLSRYRCGLVIVAAAMLVTAQPALAEPGPANVRIADGPCLTDETGSFVNPQWQLTYTAEVGTATEATWALWPVNDPAQRREDPAYVADGIAHGGTDTYKLTANTPYQVAVRTPESDWTTPCTVTLDTIRPNTPTATSAVYLGDDIWEPRGGLGVPGEFTFTADGSTDVVGYRYRFYRGGGTNPDLTYVPAQGLGGPATITWTPPDTGSWSLMLYPVDRAGNTSELTRGFTVRDIRPHVFSGIYTESGNDQGNIGVPGVFEFSPGLPEVVGYTYRLEDAPEQTVASGPDGKASVTLAPTHGGTNVLYVKNTTRDSVTSANREYRFYVKTNPVIVPGGLAIGTPGTIQVTSRFAGTVGYDYWFAEWGGALTPKTRIAATADESAQLAWIPPHHQFSAVYVQGFRADGAASEVGYSSIQVDDVAPEVTVTGAGEPGVPGTIRFTSRMRGITHYTFESDGPAGPTGTVTAGPDGSATVAWTPQQGVYWLMISAQAHNAAGYTSNWGVVVHRVNDEPRVSSVQYPRNGSAPLVTGTFDLAPRQLGVTEYRYTIDGQPWVTVPARADGTASFTWTPPRTGIFQFRLYSSNAAGNKSTDVLYTFTVT
jgi:hypothetical protein